MQLRIRTVVDAMHGVINVLKPPGMTSHDVVQFIRRLVGQKRVGHTGTLDPGAAGVLPVCVGKATKIIQFMNHNKEYRAEVTFGTATSTQDSFGEVTETHDCSFLTLGDICHALQYFIGEIEQIPPMTSAVKYKGKKLYELARAGIEVQRKTRRINIFGIRVIHSSDIGTPNPKVIMDVSCSAGTYIRTLCSDLGKKLCCSAHMSFLLRTGAGPFTISSALTLEELQEMKEQGNLSEAFMPPEQALSNLSRVEVEGMTANKICNGNSISLPVAGAAHLQENRWVCIQGPRGLLAIGKTVDVNQAENNIRIQPVKVLV